MLEKSDVRAPSTLNQARVSERVYIWRMKNRENNRATQILQDVGATSSEHNQKKYQIDAPVRRLFKPPPGYTPVPTSTEQQHLSTTSSVSVYARSRTVKNNEISESCISRFPARAMLKVPQNFRYRDSSEEH